MQRILVVGASSFVGQNLIRDLREKYLVYGTHFQRAPRVDGVTSYPLLITNTAPISELVDRVKPKVVIYCAGLTNDECERNPDAASLVNTYGPRRFLEALAPNQGRIIFLSTSKVFRGDRGNYSETDTPQPSGHYGQTKYQGEQNILTYPNGFIFRLGTVVGIGARQQTSAIVDRLLSDLRRPDPTSFICDEYRSFLPVGEISRAVAHAIEAPLSHAGLYHLAGASKGTYYDLARTLARVFGVADRKVLAVSGAKFKGQVTAQFRGSDLSLDASHYSQTFRQRLMPLEEALTVLRDQMRRGTQ